MKEAQKITLYHGSYMVVDSPNLVKCHDGKDFGKGFYLTSDIEQAKRFTRMSIKKAQTFGEISATASDGYISIFDYLPMGDLQIYSFEHADSEWLQCVAAHRKAGSLAGEIEKWSFYDIISGKIANDRTNAVITAYIGGLYGDIESTVANETAIKLLEPDNLKDQFCFRTEKAIGCLVFVRSERVSNER